MAGRPKSFDEDAAMDAFVDVFWTKGYGGTSVDDLQSAAGIKRGSFYASFGSKDDVFQTVMDRYWSGVTEPGLSNLEPAATALEGVASFLRHVGRFMSENPFRGCLLLSSAGTSTSNVESSEAVSGRMAQLEARLTERLLTDPDLSLDRAHELAAYVLTILLGLNAMARTGHDGSSIQSAAECAAQSLNALSQKP
ncbi:MULTISPECIES: TetR/AcrR family transcriptional regulator [unclassified Roseibium]|uniref:TetR/AcrR family transcriptional regulator n=1 Tax=unclassified Roseibium TaxID=2629323 RepID=UPI00274023BE|nr:MULTISPECIES: TetR/AcrR family transcriptional regulator [unclassified Roseibium]